MQWEMIKQTLFDFGWEQKAMWIRQFISVQKNDSVVVVQRCAENALQENKYR